jgi:hypothetical protein
MNDLIIALISSIGIALLICFFVVTSTHFKDFKFYKTTLKRFENNEFKNRMGNYNSFQIFRAENGDELTFFDDKSIGFDFYGNNWFIHDVSFFHIFSPYSYYYYRRFHKARDLVRSLNRISETEGQLERYGRDYRELMARHENLRSTRVINLGYYGLIPPPKKVKKEFKFFRGKE